MADLGLSFMPQATPQPGNQPQVDPSQEAIKILSLRLPHVLGGSAFAPAPLLNGPGGGANPFANSAVGQTQQGILPNTPQAMASPAMGPAGASLTGAQGLGGGMPPDMLLKLLQLLAGGPMGNAGQGSYPTPNVRPGDQGASPDFSVHPIPGPAPAPPTVTLNQPPPPDLAQGPSPAIGGGAGVRALPPGLRQF